MNHSTRKPTKAQQARFVAMKYDGCLCCRIDGLGFVEPDIHHLKRGNKRRGHDATIALCLWHHRGIRTFVGPREAGPSLANGSRTFHEYYGSDDALLNLQNIRLGMARKVA